MAERQRRMVSCDLTGEEDAEFLAWVEERRSKNKLSHEIREGLWLRYRLSQRGMGKGPLVLSQGIAQDLASGRVEGVAEASVASAGQAAVLAVPAGPAVAVDPAAAERLRGRAGALLGRFG